MMICSKITYRSFQYSTENTITVTIIVTMITQLLTSVVTLDDRQTHSQSTLPTLMVSFWLVLLEPDESDVRGKLRPKPLSEDFHRLSSTQKCSRFRKLASGLLYCRTAKIGSEIVRFPGFKI